MEIAVAILFFVFLVAFSVLMWSFKKESKSGYVKTLKTISRNNPPRQEHAPEPEPEPEVAEPVSEPATEDTFEEGIKLGGRFVEMYEKWIEDPFFRCQYNTLTLPEEVATDEELAFMFIADVVFSHHKLGYTVNVTDRAAIPLFKVYLELLFINEDDCKHYDYLLEHPNMHEVMNNALRNCESAMASRPVGMIAFLEVLRKIDKEEMGRFIDIVKDYADWLCREAHLDEARVAAWKDELQEMLSIPPRGFFIFESGCRKVFDKLAGTSSFSFDSDDDDFDLDDDDDIFDEDEDDDDDIFDDEDDEDDLDLDEDDDEQDEFDFDMTKDYYGKHGEFDKNDEARSTSEYIQIFHHEDPDADPTDQFHWDEVLDAKSDGYLDEE